MASETTRRVTVASGTAAKPTLYSIQYLRALAAAAVLLHHSGLSHSNLGGSGVDLFFVISGFIMALVCGPRTTPASFAASRFFRIFPIYWIVTLVAAAVDGCGWTDVATSLLLWPSAVPIVSQGWTLQIEVFFYGVVAVAIWVSPDRMRVIASLLLLVLVGAGLLAQPESRVLRVYSNPIVLEFVVGLWLHRLWSSRVLPSRRQAGWVIAGVFAYFAVNTQMPPPSDWLRVAVWGAPHALLLWAALGLEAAGSVPHLRLLRFLGDASYSLYLVHQLVLAFLKPLLWHLPGAAVVGTELAVSEGLAAVTYLALERPLLRAGRQAARLTGRVRTWRPAASPPSAPPAFRE